MGSYAMQVNKGPWTTPAIRSRSPKDTTSRSLISNDSRYTRAKDSYAEPRGARLHRRSIALWHLAGRDEVPEGRGTTGLRTGCPAWALIPRGWPRGALAPHVTQLGMGFSTCLVLRRVLTPEPTCLQALGSNIAPWADVSPKKRVEVPDYRFAGRFSEAKKEPRAMVHAMLLLKVRSAMAYLSNSAYSACAGQYPGCRSRKQANNCEVGILKKLSFGLAGQQQ
eukprot:1140065-Pelagomonas_calceolata.AAC.6